MYKECTLTLSIWLIHCIAHTLLPLSLKLSLHIQKCYSEQCASKESCIYKMFHVKTPLSGSLLGQSIVKCPTRDPGIAVQRYQGDMDKTWQTGKLWQGHLASLCHTAASQSRMSAVGAFTVTKENIEDDRALLTRGVIGTGTEVSKDKEKTRLLFGEDSM